MVIRRWSAVFLLVFAGAAFAQRPLPLDPLADEEIAKAEQIARGDGRVREIAPNGRKITVQFISAKVPDANGRIAAEPVDRFAQVLLHNDERKVGARALVNLSTGKVVDVVTVPENLVDLGDSDIEIAAGLALENPRVRELVGAANHRFHVPKGRLTREVMNDDIIMGVRTVGGAGLDPCTRDRCVVLFFRSAGRYIAMNQVTVDLTQRRVFVTGRQP